jgi:sulfite dehydrogenase (cytochrome) subunit B
MRTLALALLLGLPAAAAVAAPLTYKLPPETTNLAPGPERDLVARTCTACHSADYITTQARPLPDPHAFWSAEVAKMRGPYGASIDDADAQKIVEYLTATYGK